MAEARFSECDKVFARTKEGRLRRVDCCRDGQGCMQIHIVVDNGAGRDGVGACSRNYLVVIPVGQWWFLVVKCCCLAREGGSHGYAGRVFSESVG
jgi:hypothetical protein